MHFGKYEVISEIARGGMGVVYKARDPFIDRILAVKTLLPEADVDEQLKRRMIIEARAAGNLRHPNIVTIYDLGVIDGRPYIAMEYLEGMDLARVIRKHPKVLLANKLRIIATAAEALDFAHRRNVVHRDIKPPNIFILNTGLLKVVDFGIARVSDGTLTSTGQVMGTLAYMAPEQISGRSVDRRADIFGLGVVFYELLARKRPFNAPEVPNLLQQILNQPHPPCPGLAPEIAASLQPILDRALAKDPAARYPSMAELAADIRHVITEKADLLPVVDAANVAELNSRIERAESLLASSQLEESVAAIQEALAVDPTDERALGLSERIEEDRFRQQVRAELSRIQELVERNELKNARSALRLILRRDSSLFDARKMLEQVEDRLRAVGELERDPTQILSSLPRTEEPESEPTPEAEGTRTIATPASNPGLAAAARATRAAGSAAAAATAAPAPTAVAVGRPRSWLPLVLAGIGIAAISAVIALRVNQRPEPAPTGPTGPIATTTTTQLATPAVATARESPASTPAPPSPIPSLTPESTVLVAATATLTPEAGAVTPVGTQSPGATSTPTLSPAETPTPAPTATPTPSTTRVAVTIQTPAPSPAPTRTTAKTPTPTPTPNRAEANAFVARALSAAGERRWGDARMAYENAAKLLPGDPQASGWRAWSEAELLAEAADAQLAGGSFAAAAATYGEALDRLQTVATDLGLRGQIAGQMALAEGEVKLASNDYDGAEAAFRRSSDVEAGARGLKRTAEARSHAEKKKKEESDRKEAAELVALRREADEAFAKGDFALALAKYNRLAEKQPDDAELAARLKTTRALDAGRTALAKKDCASVNTALAGIDHAAAKKMKEECAELVRPRRAQVAEGMVAIPAGSFEMGEGGGLPDMKPQHDVALPAYLIDKYKATCDRYAAFLAANGRRPPAYWKEGEPPTGQGNHPVRWVSYGDAKAYCKWAGKRLPSEAEWEHAARGPKNQDYPWGNGHDRARYNSGSRTQPVEAGSASGFGVVGLIDYVWEWTQSTFAPYPGNKEPDPRYGSQMIVVRGPLKTKGDKVLSAASRHALEPDTSDEHLGFRCAIGAAELAAIPE